MTLLHRATKTTIKADARIKTDLTVSWVRTLIGEGLPGEIKLGRVGGRRMIATVEPWHGKSVVIYAEQPGVWARSVIESEITGGHALGWADFDGDGSDELAVGWRDQKPGVAIYTVDREGALKSKVMIDEGGMATEDLVVADLNGDKRPDIIASGRATRNVKIYWNETRPGAGRSATRHTMKLSNLVATVALLGITIAGAHAGSQTPQQPPPPPPADRPLLRPPVGRQGRGAAAVFLQQQRPPGDPAVIERGRTLYSVTCSACHGVDARGGQLGGPNLCVRSSCWPTRTARRSSP